MAFLRKGGVARLGSVALVGCALAFGAGCSADTGEEDEVADTAQQDVSRARTAGGSFLTLEFGDEVLTTDNGVVSARASRAYGIGAISARVVKRKATGAILGVITAYETKTGKPLFEFITESKSGETGIVTAEDFIPTMADEEGFARPEFMSALKLDLESAQRSLEASEVSPSGGVSPTWFWGKDRSCVGMALSSLVSGVLGAGMFVQGVKYSLGIAIMVGYSPTVPAGLTAIFFTALGGVVAGAALVVVGVVTLGYTAYVCATR